MYWYLHTYTLEESNEWMDVATVIRICIILVMLKHVLSSVTQWYAALEFATFKIGNQTIDIKFYRLTVGTVKYRPINLNYVASNVIFK